MATLLITNANIITLDPGRPRASAMLVHDGRIAAFDETIPSACDAPVQDIRGCTVVPGFIDSHVHFLWTGVQHFALDLRGITTIADVQALVADHARDLPAGQLIFAQGLDVEACTAGAPTAADLDAAAPTHPVVLRGDTGHLSIANTLAMRQFGLDSAISGWHANGLMIGAAHTIVAWSAPTRFAEHIGWTRVFGAAATEAASVGITTIHALEGDDKPDDVGVRALLQHASTLPVRIVLYWQTTHVAAVQALELPRIGGCIWVDGDFGPHTAALKQPYADRPCTCGQLYISDDRLQTFVDTAHAAGLQIALHSVGDAAVEQVLRAYRRALRQHPCVDHRHRIEHFELYDADLLHDARELGVSVAIQPAFDGYFGGIEYNAQYLGWERAQRADAIATFDRHGIPIGGGSDSTVTPLDPLYGMHCAVHHSNPNEHVSPERALRLWTIDNARLAFEERDKGTLEVGKLADFVVLDADPLAMPTTSISDITVLLTVMGGTVTYERQEGH
jgi:predicted amidohydrolase YtcJ